MSSRLRILYFSLSFPELSQTFVINEMRNLRDLGCDVSVLALRKSQGSYSELPEKYGLASKIHYAMPPGRMSYVGRVWSSVVDIAALCLRGHGPSVMRLARMADRPLALSSLLRVARRLVSDHWNTQVIHSHFGPAGRVIACLRAAKFFATPFSTVFHGYDLSSFVKVDPRGSRYQQIFRLASRLIAISEAWAGQLIAMGAPPERVRHIRLGVDCQYFAPVVHPPDSKTIRIVSVGRLTEKKGHRYALQAIAKVAQAAPELNIEFHIIGDGEDRDNLVSLARELRIDAIVRFRGGLPQERIAELLKSADIFVLHSVTAANGDMEGIPVSIMEAMACGLPVVSTIHSGIPELVESGVQGILVPERDDVAFASAIERLARSPELSREIGRRGRERVAEHYNDATQAQILKSELAAISVLEGPHTLENFFSH